MLSPRTGRSLEGIRRQDLGRAIRAIAGKESLVTMCGEERADALAAQVQAIRDRLEALPEGDEGRGELQMRGARLAGQTATLKIGAHTESQRAYLQARAEKALRALPLAMRHGVVPGGGAAYVHCLPAVTEAVRRGAGRRRSGPSPTRWPHRSCASPPMPASARLPCCSTRCSASARPTATMRSPTP